MFWRLFVVATATLWVLTSAEAEKAETEALMSRLNDIAAGRVQVSPADYAGTCDFAFLSARKLNLTRSNLKVILGTLHFSFITAQSTKSNVIPIAFSFVESFCCCRRRGMLPIAPQNLQDLKNFYDDIYDAKILDSVVTFEGNPASQNIKYGDKLLATGFHGYKPSTYKDVYGTKADLGVAFQQGSCLEIVYRSSGLEIQSAPCEYNARTSSFAQLGVMCTALRGNGDPAETCFVDGLGCNAKSVEEFVTTGVCPEGSYIPTTTLPTTTTTTLPTTTTTTPHTTTTTTTTTRRPRRKKCRRNCSWWSRLFVNE